MRVVALVVGLMGVSAVSAGELQSGFDGSDAAAGQLVYEARFGGERDAIRAPSFQLRFGSERQLLAHAPVPFQAEYRTATGSVLLNGVDISPMFVSRQAPEESIFSSAIGGWIPLLLVLTAATLIVVDGNRAEYGTAPTGTGGTGG